MDPCEKEGDATVYAVVKHKNAPVTASNGEAAARSHFPVLWVCLGILSVLLVLCISVIIYISVLMDKQKANLKDLEEEIQQLTEKSVIQEETERLITEKSVLKREMEQLITERNTLKKETERLSRAAENANHTMGVILKFKSFPVNKYCLEKKCQPCQKGWILFQKKCYLFYDENSPWKTWEQSQKLCQDTAADLVVVNSPQEQEFISQHIKYYFDKHHGYWLGLHKSDEKWRWVDGRNDTLGYWMTIGSSGPCGLILPQRNLTANWDPAQCHFENKFICESEALIKSD
ncbi:CD209 antigen-like protein A [Halichoeres trimaculatus]|uniref:CD209 antigen-like protein A n=1 Tax=Halichoeres trimaculatus TaxID=147232 RepID=UPI003D9F9628